MSTGWNQYNLSIINSSGIQQELELRISPGERIAIGRDTVSNQVVLPYPFVSSHHGEFFFENGDLWYCDLRSTNGTAIESNGAHSVLFRTDKKARIRDGAIIRIGTQNDAEIITILLYRKQGNESWRKVPIGKKPLTIGRSSKNDIVLKSSGVSRNHAIIFEHNGVCTLRNLKSTNGLLLNGRFVDDEIELKTQDVIQILDYQMLFSGNLLFYKTSAKGVNLETVNLNKVVDKGKKTILNHVNCTIESNEFVAIVGGSGAGKTTLMTAMSGFDKEVQGTVFCNGINLLQNFQHLKSMIGYVPQQDIIYENLTLRRMLYYTAKLKMPKDTSQQEIEEKIDEILEIIELKEHQNNYIRKLSGGQKKRASIAVELLADPKLFFLDEPTSGLDPGTEKNLMATLSKLSKTRDKTIIMVTHTTQNLHMCDKIIFMGPGGRLCFCGTAEQALMFFDTDSLVNIYNIIAENPALWEEQYARCMVGEMHEKKQSADRQLRKDKKSNALHQLLYLCLRYAELIKNDLPRLLLIFLQPLIIGGLLYVVSDEDIFDIYESTKSLLFALSCAGIWMGLFNSIQEICKERVIVKREYMANLKLPIYILSKILIQAVIGLLQTIILVGVFLLAVGKSKEGLLFDHFYFEIFLTIWLTILASMAIGFIISSVVKTGDKAMAVAPFILIIQLLFSGILFKLEGFGKAISCLTISRWSVEALGSICNLNDMQHQMQEQFPTLQYEAESAFEFTKDHLMTTWGILLLMLVIFLVGSFILLRNVAKDNR